jgi:hypothetical protein
VNADRRRRGEGDRALGEDERSELARGPDTGNARIAGWTWKPVPLPVLMSLAPRGRAWEMVRYQVTGVPTGGLANRGERWCFRNDRQKMA